MVSSLGVELFCGPRLLPIPRTRTSRWSSAGAAHAPTPLVLFYDGFVSEGFGLVAFRGCGPDGLRRLRRTARSVLRSLSLLHFRSGSSQVGVAATLLPPGSWSLDVFPSGVQGDRKHRSDYEDDAVANTLDKLRKIRRGNS